MGPSWQVLLGGASEKFLERCGVQQGRLRRVSHPDFSYSCMWDRQPGGTSGPPPVSGDSAPRAAGLSAAGASATTGAPSASTKQRIFM